MSQLMRLWYLSLRRPAKTQASLRIRAISPDLSLFAHMKYGRRRRVWPKIGHLSPLDIAAHMRLKNEFTEAEKYHDLMRWLKWENRNNKKLHQNKKEKNYISILLPFLYFSLCTVHINMLYRQN